MARLPYNPQADFPYHIGARTINRDWFSVPMPEVWEIMSNQLYFIHVAFGVRIHSFVLMSNHFHLILSTPSGNLAEAMAWFMRETSRAIARSGNRINQTYGGRYFRSVIGNPIYFLNAYKYVYCNPLYAGICQNVLEYPYSTLPGVLGLQHLAIPIAEDRVLFENVEQTLQWLNDRPNDEDWLAVKRALRRREFALARVNGYKHRLESDTL